jgi:hypothetical protein
MKEQQQLILALKSFLEDKTSKPESTLESDNEPVSEGVHKTSWPSATLSSAYCAALLLSSVLSSVAVSSIITKSRSSRRAAGPVFLPVDHSLPGLGTLKKIQLQPSLIRRVGSKDVSPSIPDTIVTPRAITRDTIPSSETILSYYTAPEMLKPSDWPDASRREKSSSTDATANCSTQANPSEWVQDYLRTRGSVRQPGEQRLRTESRDSFKFAWMGHGSGLLLSKLVVLDCGMIWTGMVLADVGWSAQYRSFH